MENTAERPIDQTDSPVLENWLTFANGAKTVATASAAAVLSSLNPFNPFSDTTPLPQVMMASFEEVEDLTVGMPIYPPSPPRSPIRSPTYRRSMENLPIYPYAPRSATRLSTPGRVPPILIGVPHRFTDKVTNIRCVEWSGHGSTYSNDNNSRVTLYRLEGQMGLPYGKGMPSTDIGFSIDLHSDERGLRLCTPHYTEAIAGAAMLLQNHRKEILVRDEGVVDSEQTYSLTYAGRPVTWKTDRGFIPFLIKESEMEPIPFCVKAGVIRATVGRPSLETEL